MMVIFRRIRFNKTFPLLFVLAALLMLLYMKYFSNGYSPEEIMFALPQPANLIVDTEACKIPGYDPWDDTVKDLASPGFSPNCHLRRPLDATYVGSNPEAIYLRKPNLYSITKCYYASIIRVDDSINNVNERPEGFSSSQIVDPKDEYVRVRCVDSLENTKYTNIYTFARDIPTVEEASKRAFIAHKEAGNDEYMNVLMLGIDSLSRVNTLRQYSKTRRFVLDELGAIEMKGHSKVGENSFPNLTPIMTGTKPGDVKGEVLRFLAHNHYDLWPFLWKEFQAAGYHTFFSEDIPPLNAWNVGSSFAKPPCDNYFRPAALEIDKTQSMFSKDKICFGQRSWSNITMDYLNQSLSMWKDGRDRPFFAFHFVIVDSPHTELLNVSSDEITLKYLQEWKQRGALNNTVVVLFGDHGVRWGPFSQTTIGQLEGRLPALFFSFPKWFRDKYPNIVDNLRANSDRLTSHFDTHKTIQSFVNFKASQYLTSSPAQVISFETGMTLLRKVPTTRICSDAGIPQNWCPCQALKEISTSAPHVQRVGKEFYHFITDYISRAVSKNVTNASECAALKFDSVTQSFERPFVTKAENGDLVNQVQVMVTIRTLPGGALLSGSAVIDQAQVKIDLSSDFTRVNTYGTQSWCVTERALKLICFCKEQKTR